MKLYIGTKFIKAELEDKKSFNISKGLDINEGDEDKEGYRVEYPDGYISWSPRHVFESAYRLVSDSEFTLMLNSKTEE